MLAEKSGGVVEWFVQTTRAPAPLLWVKGTEARYANEERGMELTGSPFLYP